MGQYVGVSQWNDQERRAELKRKLWRVAQAPLTNVFRDPSGRDQQEYSVLVEAAKELEPGKWRQREFYDSLKRVIERAIELLPDKEGPSEYSRLSWREIAATLYGFENADDAEQVDTKKPYNRRYEIVRQRSHTSDPRLRAEVVSRCFKLLADKLVSLKPVGAIGTTRSSDAPAFTPLYVTRPALHEAFNELVARGEKVIVLAGRSGMGKTWLARELTMNADGSEAPCLQIIDGDLFYAHFENHHPDATSLQRPTALEDPKDLIARLSSGPQPPKFVILDDIGNARDLHEYVPIAPIAATPTIVATCDMFWEAGPIQDWKSLSVGEMETREAHSLASNRVPHLSEPDAAKLVETLGGYPLLLHHVCAFLKRQGATVDELFDKISELTEPPEVPGQRNRALRAILVNLLRAVYKVDSVAYDLLVLITRLNRWRGVPESALRVFLGANGDTPLSSARLGQAITTLVEYSLVESVQSKAEGLHFGLHPTTAYVLNQLDEAEVSTVIRRIRRVMDWYLGEYGSDGILDFASLDVRRQREVDAFVLAATPVCANVFVGSGYPNVDVTFRAGERRRILDMTQTMILRLMEILDKMNHASTKEPGRRGDRFVIDESWVMWASDEHFRASVESMLGDLD
jgi:hypothetical protein